MTVAGQLSSLIVKGLMCLADSPAMLPSACWWTVRSLLLSGRCNTHTGQL